MNRTRQAESGGTGAVLSSALSCTPKNPRNKTQQSKLRGGTAAQLALLRPLHLASNAPSFAEAAQRRESESLPHAREEAEAALNPRRADVIRSGSALIRCELDRKAPSFAVERSPPPATEKQQNHCPHDAPRRRTGPAAAAMCPSRMRRTVRRVCGQHDVLPAHALRGQTVRLRLRVHQRHKNSDTRVPAAGV